MISTAPFLAVDLGKTSCRVLMIDRDERIRIDGAGAPGLASSNGAAAAFHAIDSLLARVDAAGAHLAVGAAGAWAAPEQAAALAHRLAERTGAPVVVASDVVTAHLGALGGAHGTLLIAGTGAAAMGVDAEGARLVDGWGPDLGDFGSGSWLGREMLRAALRADVGLGPRTALTRAVAERVGPASAIPSWLARDEALGRRLASLAPAVLDAAEDGDAVALGIVDDAVQLLAASAVAASSSVVVAMHGGLTGHAWFVAKLVGSLETAGRAVMPAAGDALDGALLLARRTDLPHERLAHRAE